tara:strand:- start:25 stop:486 length:462 start_codon:yes stop_codon:yes gene_type:complete
MYAKIQNNKIDKFPYTETDLKKENPSTSFPINPLENTELREAFDVVEVQENPQPGFNAQTHKCVEKNPEFKNGNWGKVWGIKTKTSVETTQDDSNRWAEVRNQRNRKLQETDWQMTKALETGEDASDLRNYRQKLRDIPQDQTNPFAITWPEL